MRTEESKPYEQEDCSEAKHLTNDLPFQQNLGGAACKTKSRERTPYPYPVSGLRSGAPLQGEDNKIHEIGRCG